MTKSYQWCLNYFKRMGVFVLEIKATLEEVESLTVVPGVLWKLDIENEASEVGHRDIWCFVSQYVPFKRAHIKLHVRE